MRTQTQSKKGFTLIEMLVVIAIIAILAGLLFPAIGRALETAKRNKAGAEARSISVAITQFYSDYNYLPMPLNAQGGDGNQILSDGGSREVIQTLIAEPAGANSNHQLNPRRTVYLQMENATSSGEALDPWGVQYHMVLDYNWDGIVEYRGNSYRTRALVLSSGRSRDLNNHQDNIASLNLQD